MNTHNAKLWFVGIALLAVAGSSFGNIDPYAGQFFKQPEASRAIQPRVPYSVVPDTLIGPQRVGERPERICKDHRQSVIVS